MRRANEQEMSLAWIMAFVAKLFHLGIVLFEVFQVDKPCPSHFLTFDLLFPQEESDMFLGVGYFLDRLSN